MKSPGDSVGRRIGVERSADASAAPWPPITRTVFQTFRPLLQRRIPSAPRQWNSGPPGAIGAAPIADIAGQHEELAWPARQRRIASRAAGGKTNRSQATIMVSGMPSLASFAIAPASSGE